MNGMIASLDGVIPKKDRSLLAAYGAENPLGDHGNGRFAPDAGRLRTAGVDVGAGVRNSA